MSQNEKLTPETVANRAADWVSTAMSVPLVWPKTTALVCLGVIACSVGLYFLPNVKTKVSQHSNERRLQQMTEAVEQADMRIRLQNPGLFVKDEEERGVWNVLREKEQIIEPAQPPPGEESRP